MLLILLININLSAQDTSIYLEAKNMADQRNYKDAIAHLENTIPEQARGFLFYYWRGNYRFFENTRLNRREALSDLLRAYPSCEDDFMINYLLGWIYGSMQDLSKSTTYLEKAYRYTEKQGGKRLAVSWLVEDYYNSKQYQKALKFSSTYLKDSGLLLYYGMAHGRLGHKEDSAKYIQQALSSGELKLSSKLMYAKYLIIMGEYDEAQKYIDELIAVKDTHVVALAMNGYLRMILGEMDEAEQCFRDAIKIDFNNEAAWQFFMYYWYLKGKIAEASTSYTMYIGISRDLDEASINYDMQEIKEYLETDELFQVLIEARKQL